MWLFNYKKISAGCLLVALLAACGGSKDPAPVADALDRQPMLTHMADNIILPSYNNFKVKLDVMTTKSNAFITAPTTVTLTEFRTAWLDAYTEWQKVELFEIGPGDKYTIRNFFNIYPVSEAGVAANINDPSANLAVPAAYPTQGFPALDFMLNGLATTDQNILVYYTTDADAAKRLAYIRRITDRMNSVLESVISEWKSTYRDTFVNKTSLDIGSPTSTLVNAYVLYYERYIRSGKIGIPAGATASGTTTRHPEKVEAYYKKDISLLLAKTAHQAVIDFFNGKNVTTGEEGPSLKTYLDALEAKDSSTGTLLSTLINAQFTSAQAKLSTLSANLYEQVQTNAQPMIDTYTEMQKAVRMLKVDMTSAMSITITYTDNDGD